MGWFWGPDIRFSNQRDESALIKGNVNGIIKTRVGYTGGDDTNQRQPNYKNIIDYTECVQIWYDDTIETYNKLLKEFFDEYDPRWPARRQYRWVIWYQNDKQKEAALQKSQEYNKKVPIEPLNNFYLAEPYHQKFKYVCIDILAMKSIIRKKIKNDIMYVDI